VLRIGVQVARGLAAAHAQGLVHRDVKPANILLEKGVDRVMLTDFGLARAIDDASLTRSGVIAGTPQYMSPEQARGEGIDARSDLFSLGSVLYALCTGRPPFRAETSYGILRRVTDDEPRSIRDVTSEIPAWLESVVQKLLSKSPDDRYANSETVAELLEDCVAHVQQPTVNPLPKEIGVLPVAERSQHRAWWLITGGVMAVSVMACVAMLSGESDSSDVPKTAAGNEVVEEASRVATPVEETNEWTSDADQSLNNLNDEIDQLMFEINQDEDL